MYSLLHIPKTPKVTLCDQGRPGIGFALYGTEEDIQLQA